MSRLEKLQQKWGLLMERMRIARIMGSMREYYRLDSEINMLELEIQKELRKGKPEKDGPVQTV